MRHASSRPHRRLLALGAAGALGVVAVAGLGFTASAQVEDQVEALQRREVAVERDLSRLRVAIDTIGIEVNRTVSEQLLGDAGAAALAARRSNDAWLEWNEARAALAEELGGGTSEAYDDLEHALGRWETGVYESLGPSGLSSDEAVVRDAVSSSLPAFDAVRSALVPLEAEVAAQVDERLAAAGRDAGRGRTAVALVGAWLAAVVVALTGLLVRRRRREAALDAAEQAERERDADRNHFESLLQRGLEMVNDEESSYRLITGALDQRLGGASAELLLADSSQAHLRQVLRSGDAGRSGCPVGSPLECPAANRGQAMTFASSRDLDACPHLKDRPDGDCSATCVPVSIAGKTIGVLHVAGDDGVPLPQTAVRDLEVVGRRTSERLTLIRAFADSATQASTDPLTGLFNRRSLEGRARELVDRQGSGTYSVAYGDLDHFKLLNDVHGHDGGDRALRLFAGVLRDAVRPSDVVARYGGEEFVVLLPGSGATEAQAVLDRVRDRLAAALTSGRVPSFTVSFGIATSAQGHSFAEVLDLADQALLTAKRSGRDRIVVAGPDSASTRELASAGER